MTGRLPALDLLGLSWKRREEYQGAPTPSLVHSASMVPDNGYKLLVPSAVHMVVGEKDCLPQTGDSGLAEVTRR